MMLMMYRCVEVSRSNRPHQQQSHLRYFSRTFVTVPSPTEPGFVVCCTSFDIVCRFLLIPVVYCLYWLRTYQLL